MKRMDELNLNRNQLSEMVKSKGIPRQTTYDFLSGRTDARTEVASALMKALRLTITKKGKKKVR
jgi:predicted transcriptional regulator